MIYYVLKTAKGLEPSRTPHYGRVVGKFESLSAALQFIAVQRVGTLADAIFATGVL
jgi:hypothetical protein